MKDEEKKRPAYHPEPQYADRNRDISESQDGRRDVLIVGLNREIPSGESFGLEDVEWTKAILHISDVESLQITIDCLTEELKRWMKEGEG